MGAMATRFLYKVDNIDIGTPDHATWWSYFLTNQNNLNNFSRGWPKDHFYQIILKSEQKFLKVFPIGSHGNQISL